MFRRCLYGLLLKIGAPAAFVGTAVIFSAAHGFLPGVPGLFFIGMVFQIVNNTTRNLWCSVICHALHNAIVITLAALTA
jgi:membrane protease YdiL (CAAX protease family)